MVVDGVWMECDGDGVWSVVVMECGGDGVWW